MKFSLSFLTLFFSLYAFSQCEIEVNDISICQNQMAVASIVENEETINLLNAYSVEFLGLEYDTLLKSVVLNIGDDEVLGPFNIGFPFAFYNQVYHQFWISSNGLISFIEPGTGYNPNQIPNLSGPFAGVFAAWEDWNPNAGGAVSYSSLNNKMIIEFKNVSTYNCGSDDGYAGTFQIALHNSTNWIDIRIVNKAECTNSLQGIQNQYGTFALAVEGRNSSLWSAQNQTIRFKPLNTNNVQWYNSAGNLVYSGSPMIYEANASEQMSAYFNSNDGCEATDTFNVNVSFPTPQIFIEGQVLLCDLSGYDYQWLLNDEIIEGANSQYYFPETAGTYTVMLSNDLGCEEFSTAYQFSPSDLTSFNTPFKSSVYPNPTRGIFNVIVNSTKTENITINVYNPLGQIIHTTSGYQINDYKNTFDFSTFASGIYHLIISTKDEKIHHTLMLN